MTEHLVTINGAGPEPREGFPKRGRGGEPVTSNGEGAEAGVPSARLSQAQLSSVWLLSTSCSHPYAPGWKECPNCWWDDVTARGRPVLAVME